MEEKGHQLRTDLGTELLVHLCEEMGDELVHRMRGVNPFVVRLFGTALPWPNQRRRKLNKGCFATSADRV